MIAGVFDGGDMRVRDLPMMTTEEFTVELTRYKAISFYKGLVGTGYVVWEDVTQRYNPCGVDKDLGPEEIHDLTEIEKERLAVLKLLTETTYIKYIGFTYKYVNNDSAYVVIREHQE